MRCLAIVALLALFTACNAQSLCAKYAMALFGNNTASAQAATIQAAINAIVGNVVANPVLLPYFNGTEGPTNFLTNSAALNSLKASLQQFFGEAIGCVNFAYTGPNMQTVHSSMTIEKLPYETFNVVVLDTLNAIGFESADLRTVAMLLDQFRDGNGDPTNAVCNQADCVTSPYTVYIGSPSGMLTDVFVPDYYTIPENFEVTFVNRLGSSANLYEIDNEADCSAKSASPDVDTSVASSGSFTVDLGADASTTVGQDYFFGFNDGTPANCDSLALAITAATGTICERYAFALSGTSDAAAELSLMQAVIDAVVGNVVADPTTGPFFTGVANVTLLKEHLVQFFGSALGCRASGFPTYAGNPNMQQVHSGMNINHAAFDTFNRIVLGTANGLGVVPADLYEIAKVLDGFRSTASGAAANNVICQATDCYTSPFIIYAGWNNQSASVHNVFNPPYMTVPKDALIIVKYGGGSAGHTFTPSAGIMSCVANATASATISSGSPLNVQLSFPAATPNGVEKPYMCTFTGHCASGMYATLRLFGGGVTSTTGGGAATTGAGGAATTGAATTASATTAAAATTGNPTTTGATVTGAVTTTSQGAATTGSQTTGGTSRCPVNTDVEEAPTDCTAVNTKKSDSFCGWCHDTTDDEFTYYFCGDNQVCNGATCEDLIQHKIGESCDSDKGYDECTLDEPYEVACLPQNGGGNICGGINVLTAGQSCSTSNSQLPVNDGCISPSVCDGTVCKVTEDGSTPAADAPCHPNSYLEGTSCTARIAIGATCDPLKLNCANNARCVTVGSASTCVEVYSVGAGGDCGAFDDVCMDGLTCGDDDKCTALPNHLLEGCTSTNVDSFCGSDEDYLCICNYHDGTRRCYGDFNRIGKAYRSWAQCMVDHNCDFSETFFPGACGEQNCNGEYSSVRKAEAKAASDLGNASGLGSGAAAVVVSVFAVLVAVVAMLL